MITAGRFTIGSAAITEAELEILDGATVTTAELNLLDALDRGSIIYGNSSGVTAVLGQGSADTVLTSDGTDISWEAASSGAVTRVGGQQSETTFNNTSVADYCDISGLSIAANAPFLLMLAARKDATGSGNHVNIGLAVSVSDSQTIIGDAVIGNNNIWGTHNATEVQEGVSFVYVGPRATNYQNSSTGFRTTWAGTTRRQSVFIEDSGGNTNQWPVGTLSNVTLRSLSQSSPATVGAVDEFNIYTYSTS